MMLIGVAVSSCGDSTKTPEEKKQEVFEVQIKQVPKALSEAFGTTFSYYSLKENKQIEITNDASKNNLGWDIAFLGTQGRSNSGTSGAGKAAVYLIETEDFDGIKSAEEFVADAAGWKQDEIIKGVDLLNTMPPVGVEGSFNPLLLRSNWMKFVGNKMPPDMVMKKVVYVIRLANGNEYVKLQFIDLYGKADTGHKLGDLRFRYAFIPLKGEANTAKRAGEVIYDKEAPLAEGFTPEKAAEVRYLIVRKTKLKQADFQFIKEKMTGLKELDLSDATLEIDYNDNFMKDNKSVKKLIMPKAIDFVGKGWLGYNKLEKIVFHPNSIKKIGNGAFSFAQELKEVVLPNSVESMEEYAFYACFKLKEIEIPEKVMLLPPGCFMSCRELQKVVIKGKVRTLGADMFNGCTKLEQVKFSNPTPPTYTEYPFNGVNWDIFKIHVPKGSVSTYIEAWKANFKPEHAKYFVEY